MSAVAVAVGGAAAFGASALGASAMTALAVGAGASMLTGQYQASQAAGDAAAAQAAGLSSAAASSVDVANIQAQSAADYLAFQKEQYADMKPLAEAISSAQLDVMNQQMSIADANEQRAAEYYNYEQGTFRPVEEAIVKDALDYNTEQKREQLASQGIADVRAAYDQQRQQALSVLASYGINPNSERFAALNAQLAQGEAAASAGAGTNARTNAEQLGYARMIDAASLGRNLASNASTAYGLATTAGSNASATGSNAYSTAAAPGSALGGAYNTYSNMLGNANSSYGTAGNLYSSGYRTAMYGQQAADSGTSALTSMAIKGGLGYASTGTWAGAASALTGVKYADGGKVHKGAGHVAGPGGPVDDKIPAMLSNGEYVLPADTVKAIGKHKLDELISQTHTPAAVQRRALKGV